MAGSSRFVMLLPKPFPLLLRNHRSALVRLARHALLCSSLTSLPPLSTSSNRLTLSPTSSQLGFQVNASHRIHSQTSPVQDEHLGFSSNSPAQHPWPEWSKLIHALSTGGYVDCQKLPVDEFVAYQDLSEEFVRASSACLAFSRDRFDLISSLSRRDIGVVVENGTPFLFKSALDTARRMRAFLGIGGGSVLESDKAQTVDLMKYLLSYASSPTVSSERGSLYSAELVESSVRNLLSELARLSCGGLASEPPVPTQFQFQDGYGQPTRPLGQKIEMKRGDWICPRCNFMNFARNIKCLECNEARPKRQLTGGEWECPQCDFFNYGRNLVCLRCDCKRPQEASPGTANFSSGLGYSNVSYANKPDVDRRLAVNEEKAERWFSKVSQLDSASDLTSAAADEDFPEIMPLRKGVNRFVVSTRKTPLEQRLANNSYRRNLGGDSPLEGNDFQNKDASTSVSQRLDEVLGQESSISSVDKKNATGVVNAGMEANLLSSPAYGHPKGSNSNYVPSVPLPDDMLAHKPQSSKREGSENVVTQSIESISFKLSKETASVSDSCGSGESIESLRLYEAPSNQNKSKDEHKEQAKNSETWFKKLTDLHNDTDLSSTVLDDFPEVMPMRKGENRFVVSKKKDRSLSSPIYKRRMAMEQTSNANFVPFVPFPPDYFAKKDKPKQDEPDATVDVVAETSSPQILENARDSEPGVSTTIDHVKRRENQQPDTGSWNSQSPGENFNARKSGIDQGRPISTDSMSNSSNLQATNQENWSTAYSGKERTNENTNLMGNSLQHSGSQKFGNGWTGKSLEGMAVQEPDPLDMSEEAKAQRFFRRVAQIKDISELSKIPDEDFPSIMPMRKGVNRFVVSKRKTPLERRLTSPQYRKNLPVVSSDSLKKENDNS